MIIASRSLQGWTRLGLEPLPLEVAGRFLLQRMGKDEHVAADEIAESLGGLPLALEQAPAYLVENPWLSLPSCSRAGWLSSCGRASPEDYPLPVASTWNLSLARLEQEQPAAADLLRLCAFLAPDDIPVAVLRSGSEEPPADLGRTLGDEMASNRVLRALRGYSLLKRREDALHVHRLVQ